MNTNTERDRGQVLVLVALSLLVLIAFVALAVDVGSIYQGRRFLQNAADAGALAGAEEICFGELGTEDAAMGYAWDYAVDRNGAEDADITVSWPVSVTVVAKGTVETYFAGLMGFPEVPVSADATAACGKSEAVGPVRPIAFRNAYWDVSKKCGQKVILWIGSTKYEQSSCVEFD